MYGPTRKDLTRKVLNLKKSGKSGPDSLSQELGIGNIGLDRVVRLG